MKRLWPFRSMANFTLTVLGVSGLGLLYNSIANERIFSNSSIVAESVKILSHNDTLRNLLGK